MSKIGLLLGVLATVTLGASVKKEIQQSQELLKQTIEALKRNLDFFKTEYTTVNLDAIIGTRMVEGQLKMLLQHFENNQDSWPVDIATIQDVRDLQELARDISNRAIPFIAQTDPEYYKRIGALIQPDSWTQDFTSKDFSDAQILRAWLPRKGEAMHEEDSDNCLTELFGTGPYTNEKCHISAGCWELMTKPGYSGYSLSHQVFYLQIGYQMGCSEQMDHQRRIHKQAPASNLVDEICASMYIESSVIASMNYPELKRDLFMEQTALCGVMGYRWFFSPEWLKQIISWQDPTTGCYKGRTLLESQVDFRDQSKTVTPGHRVRREERILDGGCLAHRTTVAAGALAEYIRYIVEFEQMTLQQGQTFHHLK